MTNLLVLKARAGITFIAFYQYGRQYNKEAQLPLEKEKKCSKSLISWKLLWPSSIIMKEVEWNLAVSTKIHFTVLHSFFSLVNHQQHWGLGIFGTPKF